MLRRLSFWHGLNALATRHTSPHSYNVARVIASFSRSPPPLLSQPERSNHLSCNFCTNPRSLKKKDKNKSRDLAAPHSESRDSTPSERPPDVDDFSDLNSAIAHIHESLKADLAKIKVGGISRDLEAIENVRVRLGKGSKPEKGSEVTIGDVASVVPRSGKVHVLVGEREVRHNFLGPSPGRFATSIRSASQHKYLNLMLTKLALR